MQNEQFLSVWKIHHKPRTMSRSFKVTVNFLSSKKLTCFNIWIFQFFEYFKSLVYVALHIFSKHNNSIKNTVLYWDHLLKCRRTAPKTRWLKFNFTKGVFSANISTLFQYYLLVDATSRCGTTSNQRWSNVVYFNVEIYNV